LDLPDNLLFHILFQTNPIYTNYPRQPLSDRPKWLMARNSPENIC
jgi:hypothetical protein